MQKNHFVLEVYELPFAISVEFFLDDDCAIGVRDYVPRHIIASVTDGVFAD